MIRTTVTLDEDLVQKIENRFGPREYLNFSAVLRDLLKDSGKIRDFNCSNCGVLKHEETGFYDSIGLVCLKCGRGLYGVN